MEKVSEADLVKRIKAFTLNDNYAGALAVVKGVDAGRIKNPTILCMIGEVYMHEAQYAMAEEVFLRAYDRSPKNRKILDLITSLYIEMGEYAEAEFYYKEFISVASRDLHRYILRYRLDKRKGERLSVLIETLEHLKDYEYMEEWAYELATLYEAAGEDKKCIHECDEIVLWFGHGEYVDKAIALKCKLTGEPLPAMTTVEMHLAREDESDEWFDKDTAEEHQTHEDSDHTAQAAAPSADAEEMRIIDPDDALESEGVDTGIDVDIIRQVMERQQEEHAQEFQKPVSHTGILRSAMDQAAKALEDMKQSDLSDEDFEDEPQPSDTDVQDDDFDHDETDDDDFLDEVVDESSEKIFSAREFFEGTAAADEAVSVPEKALEPADSEVLDEDGVDVSEALEDMTEDQDEVLLEQAVFGGLPTGDMLEDNLDDDDEIWEESQEKHPLSEADEKFLADLFSTESSEAADDDDDADETIADDVEIPQTVKDIFSTLPNVKNVHRQLAKTLTQFETSGNDFDVLVPYDINFVVLGDDKGMRSQIAIGIAKALNTYGICDRNKIVRTKAEELNRQDFSRIFPKIKGGCLIILRADELSDASVKIIETEINKENQDVAIVFVSRNPELKDFWKRHQALRGKFLNVINVSKYNEMELVTLAKGYIEKRGYELTPEAAIVLRDYFVKHADDEKAVGYEDVMSVVDESIANLDKRNMKNLFMTVLDNKYEEAEMLKLLPEDFNTLFQ